MLLCYANRTILLASMILKYDLSIRNTVRVIKAISSIWKWNLTDFICEESLLESRIFPAT